MSTRALVATASRVLAQLRRDPRPVALVFLVPCLLLTLLKCLFDDQPETFDRIGVPPVGLFPFLQLFIVTSVTMLRERSSGTLERLMASPIAKLDLLAGYGAELFDKWLKGTRLVEERTSVRFLGGDVALVVSVGGTVMRGKSEPAPERDSIQTLVATRKHGRMGVRLVSEHPHPSHRCQPDLRLAVADSRHALAALFPRVEDNAAQDDHPRR
jgi:hypothetical protein